MIDKPHSPACERNREPILAVLRTHFADRREVLEIGSGTGQHAVHFAAAMPWLTWQCSDRAAYLPGIRQWLHEAALPNTPAPVELDVDLGTWPLLPMPLAPQGDFLRGTGSDDLLAHHRFADRPTPEQCSGGGLLGHGKPHLAAGWNEGESEAGEGTGGSRAPTPALPPPLWGQGRELKRFDAAFSANTLHIMGWPEVEAFFTGLRTALADEATLVVYGPFNTGGAYTSHSNRDFDASLRARDPRMGIRDVEAVDALARAMGLRLVDDIAMPANNRCLVWQRRR